MANIGHIEVEVKPTVTLESAVVCVMMLNMFLADNEEYDLRCVNEGDGWKWELTDEVMPKLQTGGIYSGVLSNIPNPGSPSNLTDEEREPIAKAMKESIERMAE